ncbi:putative integral membrane protein [Marinibacterium anthonyi]|nr:putative integral membrane protein [Marinibacterium anthonyi]
MTQTIGNPLSWTARAVGATGAHLAETATEIGSGIDAHPPKVRVLTRDDIVFALRAGWEDMQALRADALCLVAIYPLIGLTLIAMSFQAGLIPMIVPLIAGFALLGPVASVGLYEMSRRREAGLDVHWSDGFAVLRSPSFGAIAALALYLGVMMVLWMLLAAEIYAATLGPEPPASVAAFVGDAFTTLRGWEMIVLGAIVGGALALAVLAVSVVSFPLLVDRKVGLPVAVVTSVRVTRENPGVILGWGCIVLVALVLGALPFLLGLVIVLPVLGHATWHLYRRAVT